MFDEKDLAELKNLIDTLESQGLSQQEVQAALDNKKQEIISLKEAGKNNLQSNNAAAEVTALESNSDLGSALDNGSSELPKFNPEEILSEYKKSIRLADEEVQKIVENSANREEAIESINKREQTKEKLYMESLDEDKRIAVLESIGKTQDKLKQEIDTKQFLFDKKIEEAGFEFVDGQPVLLENSELAMTFKEIELMEQSLKNARKKGQEPSEQFFKDLERLQQTARKKQNEVASMQSDIEKARSEYVQSVQKSKQTDAAVDAFRRNYNDWEKLANVSKSALATSAVGASELAEFLYAGSKGPVGMMQYETRDLMDQMGVSSGNKTMEWLKDIRKGAINIKRYIDEDTEKNFGKEIDIDQITDAETFAAYAGDVIVNQLPNTVIAMAGGQTVGSIAFFLSGAGEKMSEIALTESQGKERKQELEKIIALTEDETKKSELQTELDNLNETLSSSEVTKFLTGVVYGTSEVVTERLFGDLRFAKEIKDVLKYLPTTTVSKSVIAALKSGAVDQGAEVVGESLNALVGNITDVLFLNQDKNIFENVPKAALDAAIFSTGFSATRLGVNTSGALINAAQTKRDKKAVDAQAKLIFTLFRDLKDPSISKKDKVEIKNKIVSTAKALNSTTEMSFANLQRLSQEELLELGEADRVIRKNANKAIELASSKLSAASKEKLFADLKEDYVAAANKKEDILSSTFARKRKLSKKQLNNVKLIDQIQANQESLSKWSSNLNNLSKVAKDLGINAIIAEDASDAQDKINKLVNDGLITEEEVKGMRLDFNGAILGGDKFIIINKKGNINDILNNKSSDATQVAQHELLHAILFKSLSQSKTDKLGEILLEHAKEKYAERGGEKYQNIFDRIENYENQLSKQEYDDVIKEEIIAFFSDEIGNPSTGKSIVTKEDVNFIQAVKQSLFEALPFLNSESNTVKLETAEDIISFLSDYNTSFSKGKLSKAAKKLVKESSATGATFAKPSLPSDLAKKVNDAYEDLGVGAAMDIVDNYRSMAAKIASRYRDRPGYSIYKDDLIDGILNDPTYGVLGLVLNFKPAENPGVPLAAYINKYLQPRSITIANQLLGKDEASTFKLDVTEVKDVMSTETAEDTIETSTRKETEGKKQYKKIIDSNIFDTNVENKIKDVLLRNLRVLNSRIDEAVSNNKTVLPFIAELKDALGKEADAIIKAHMGGKKDFKLRSFLLKAKKPILENMTTTWLMGKDNGKTVNGGIPAAIQKKINGEWVSYPDWIGKKIDRESVKTDGAGRTSGAELVRRLPNAVNALPDADYLSFVIQKDAGPIRGRKESLAKAIAEEVGFEILNKSIEEQNELYDALVRNQEMKGIVVADNMAAQIARGVERGNVKYSLSVDKADKALTLVIRKMEVKEPGSAITAISTGKYTPALKKAILDLAKALNIVDQNGELKYVSKLAKKIREEEGILIQKNVDDLLIDDLISGNSPYIKIAKEKAKKEGKDKVNIINSLVDNEGAISAKDIALNKENSQRAAKSKVDAFISMHEATENKKTIEDDLKSLIRLGSHRGHMFTEEFFSVVVEPIAKKFKLKGFSKKSLPNGRFTLHHNGKKIKDVLTQETSEESILRTIKSGKLNIDANQQEKQAKESKDALDMFKILAKNMPLADVAVSIKLMTDDMSSALRVASPVSYVYLSESKNYKDYTFEHATAAKMLGDALFLNIAGLESDNYFNKTLENSKVAIIPSTIASIIDSVYKTGFSENFSIEGNFLDYRYFANKVQSLLKEKGINFTKDDLVEIKKDNKGKELKRNTKKMYSLSSNYEFNKMLELKSDIPVGEEISEKTARNIGKKIGKYKFLIPPSADDFVGMLYAFLSAGKVGEEQFEFFKEKLIVPFNKAYYKMNAAKQAIARDYKALNKEYKDVKKILRKDSSYKGYTNDAAVRAYLYARAGYDIPGINSSDQQALLKVVESNDRLREYAEKLALVSKLKEKWVEPSEQWDTLNIEYDLNEIVDNIGRANYLAEWIENKNLIFSKNNLNKIEAIYGSKFREALEDILFRMEKGRAREEGSNRIMNTYLNWLRGSVGVTMFLNRRSALLQQLSNINFVNFSDNNPLKAAQATFLNPKQFAKDFAFIINSDYLKERRGGLKIDVNEADIANMLSNRKGFTGMIANLLKKGFVFTQFGDSLAIATGGASFYRNRINTYIQQGFSEKQAEEKAFLDFQEKSEESQQSSRPDRISMQQANSIGRLFLAFQNTPMQYARIVRKAALDLANGRGDKKAHVSRIVYYGFVQSAIFSTLQTGLFAGLFDTPDLDDDEREELLDNKTLMVINNTIDGLLKGTGVGGAAIATAKNAMLKYVQENEKGWKGDKAKVLLEIANVSPPVGIKARKLYNSMKSYDYNKKLIGEMDAGINNPAYSIAADAISVATNFPADRIVSDLNTGKAIMDKELQTWQVMALALGWNTWNIGIKDEEVDQARYRLKLKKEFGKKKKKSSKKSFLKPRKLN